jgi:hypothetical protein
MAWSVEESIFLILGIELCSSDLNSLTLGFFVIAHIHDVSEPPRISTLGFGFFLELLDSSLIDDSHFVHDLTTDGGLTSINVTDEDERSWITCGINFCETIWIHVDFNIFELGKPFLLFFFSFGLLGNAELFRLCIYFIQLSLILVILNLFLLFFTQLLSTLVEGTIHFV